MCGIYVFALLIAGALVPAATREETQEARLRERALHVRRFPSVLRLPAALASYRHHSAAAEDQGEPAAPEPVHGPALQGTMVPGK